ncbi:MAG: MATE family efflux transporter [Clostridia bacterium]|nr:MATE family efflux transporter [Clostridia bacterium]
MAISLSDHFTYKKLLRFVFPSIMMMICTSIYSVVDGFFVSNYVGKTSFAAVNLMMPVLIIMGAVGFMLGTGGTAIVAKVLGEGDRQKANRIFSFMVYTLIIGGITLSAICLPFLRPLAILLGATGQMLEDAVIYSQIILAANTFFMVQNLFQSFFIAAEKPNLGLYVTILAGVTNIVLDFLLVGVWQFGIVGAAVATILSQFVGTILPLLYFTFPNKSLLRLTKTSFDFKLLLKACGNGSSELMSNLSASVVTMLYNFQLLKFQGDNGVAAYGAIMYVNFIFAAIFFGYAMGSAPVVSFHYGAGNKSELHNLYKKSLVLMTLFGVTMAAISFGGAVPFSQLFVGYDQALMDLTIRGFRIYAFSFIISGFNLFGSAFFTALNNGGVSATISFLRTFVFQSLTVLVLPLLFQTDGIWLATTLAELLSLSVTAYFFLSRKKRYGY